MKITIGAKRSRTQNEKLFAQPRAPPLRNHGISRGPSGRLRGSSNGAGHPYDGLSGPSDLSKPSEGSFVTSSGSSTSPALSVRMRRRASRSRSAVLCESSTSCRCQPSSEVKVILSPAITCHTTHDSRSARRRSGYDLSTGTNEIGLPHTQSTPRFPVFPQTCMSLARSWTGWKSDGQPRSGGGGRRPRI
eukprot:scaffold99903_cov26-Tisochrysis_lutea.AAC.3